MLLNHMTGIYDNSGSGYELVANNVNNVQEVPTLSY